MISEQSLNRRSQLSEILVEILTWIHCHLPHWQHSDGKKEKILKDKMQENEKGDQIYINFSYQNFVVTGSSRASEEFQIHLVSPVGILGSDSVV